MIELLLPDGFDTLEYSWVKSTIGICTLADYSMAKKCQQFVAYVEKHNLSLALLKCQMIVSCPGGDMPARQLCLKVNLKMGGG
jgi:hypothetical protein